MKKVSVWTKPRTHNVPLVKSKPFLMTKRFFSMPSQRYTKLDELVKMDLLESQNPQQIEKIWLEYHEGINNSLSAVIPSETWSKFQRRASQCPFFVFPLPRSTGYLSMLVQMNVHERRCGFTPLEEYKVKAYNARSWVDLTYFAELLPSKGLVLMRGDIEDSQLSVQEARYLANIWHWYLLDDEKYAYLEIFNYKPQSFDFQSFVTNEMENFQSHSRQPPRGPASVIGNSGIPEQEPK